MLRSAALLCWPGLSLRSAPWKFGFEKRVQQQVPEISTEVVLSSKFLVLKSATSSSYKNVALSPRRYVWENRVMFPVQGTEAVVVVVDVSEPELLTVVVCGYGMIMEFRSSSSLLKDSGDPAIVPMSGAADGRALFTGPGDEFKNVLMIFFKYFKASFSKFFLLNVSYMYFKNVRHFKIMIGC